MKLRDQISVAPLWQVLEQLPAVPLVQVRRAEPPLHLAALQPAGGRRRRDDSPLPLSTLELEGGAAALAGQDQMEVSDAFSLK